MSSHNRDWACARYRMHAASLNLDFQEFAEVAQFLGFLSAAIPWLLAAAFLFALGCGQSPNPLVPTATPMPPHADLAPYTGGVPTLDENIFYADVIAWVRPPAVSGKSKTIPSEDGVAPTYRPFVEFQFEVVEYLKGSGGNTLTVEYPQSHTYLTDKESVNIASSLRVYDNAASDGQSAIFNARSDDRGAVVFLRLPEDGDAGAGASPSAQVYYFQSIDSPLNPSYISTSKKSWMPVVAPGKSVGALADVAVGRDSKFLNPESIESVAEPRELTLEYLRSRIKAVADMLAKGEGIEGYEECIKFRFDSESILREIEKAEGRPYTPETVREGPFASGLPAGTEFRSSGMSAGEGYSRQWYEGQDADLFQTAIVVEGVEIVPDYIRTRKDPVGYEISTRVARPLPRGTYKVKEMGQHGYAMPCNLEPNPDHAWTWIFTFESPAGTLHEAFFDPASIGEAAVGADASNGVLKPTAFTFGGGNVSLDSIRWESHAAEMRLSPHTRLANHHADFIALDGSVALRLDFDDAAETGEGDSRALSWPVCAQPWQAGDLLMLRISESPSDLSGVSRDGDCVSAPPAP